MRESVNFLEVKRSGKSRIPKLSLSATGAHPAIYVYPKVYSIAVPAWMHSKAAQSTLNDDSETAVHANDLQSQQPGADLLVRIYRKLDGPCSFKGIRP